MAGTIFIVTMIFYIVAKSLNFLQHISICAHQALLFFTISQYKCNLEGLSPR